MQVTTNIGTQLKFAITLECEGLSMSDYDFTARFYTFKNCVVEVPKSEMVEDEGTYLAVVDTSTFQSGLIKVEVEADIPDPDIEGGIRKEVVTTSTDVVIRKGA